MPSFSETGLSPEILQAITELGYIQPTPVQEEVIPFILENDTDLIALAQTGTGKTAAFGLPLITRLDFNDKSIKGLILSPTRELCIQITKDLQKFGKFNESFKVVPVYGGADIRHQMDMVKKGADIIVGTPGRLVDLLNRGNLNFSRIKWVVLDEADEMLNMGFQEDLHLILGNTPAMKRTMLFSATMPEAIRKIANKFMKNPAEIVIGQRNAGVINVKHEYYMVHAKDRYLALKRVADMNPGVYGIVFCRTRQETKEVAEKLIQDGYNADALHGDLSQAQREHVMNKFRTRHLRMLVATDVAARGLDVNDLTHVINYNLPDDLEVYIHRSGRTGRAGKTGISVSIIHTKEGNKIKDLAKMAKIEFLRKDVPGGKEICEKQLFHLIDKMENIEVNQEQIDGFLPAIYSKLSWLSREELIQRFVSVEFNRFLEYYENAPDINVKHETKEQGRRDSREVKFTRFFINAGKVDQLTKQGLMGMVNDVTRNKQILIGKIEILRKFSFFEIENDYVQLVEKAFNQANTEGFEYKVEISEGEIFSQDEVVRKKKKSAPSYEPKSSFGGRFDRNFKPRGDDSRKGRPEKKFKKPGTSKYRG
ncbi:MAG: DEAD/DEAH box helicase [Bacteroidales bacterium]|nr:DEAD/DEAH box helicase [Bacteroidales bacterium]